MVWLSGWNGTWAYKPKGHRLDSGQGTCLGCGPGPWLVASQRQLIDVSRTLMFPSLSFSVPPRFIYLNSTY